ncbi:Pycsar system effector family protein [Sorangium sp. So ce296]|uniref:Pycsar system effector family protein n=1 Tax=Sorangium sp. So ce296 TaxID=3133296 RepID=UPI003F6429E5
MDSAEFSSKANAYLTEYVKIADAKAGAILAFAAAVGAVVSATSERMLTTARTAAWWAFWLGAVTAAAVAVSVLMTLVHTIDALSPRTGKAEHSLHSFPDIANMASEAYVNAVVALTPEAISRNYSLHNHTLAQIALAKFGSIEKAMCWLRIAVLAAFVLALLYACAGAAPDKTEVGRPQSSFDAQVSETSYLNI